MNGAPAPRGVILAAGYGSRFLPVTKVVPKELLPIIDRPAIDLVVQELIDAGVREILVITSRRKRAIEDWFDRAPELEQAFADAPDKLARVRPPDVSVTFIRQARMNGTGGALALARSFAGDRPVIVAFPDDLFGSPNPSAALWRTHQQTGGSVIAALDRSGQDVSAYGVIDGTMERGILKVRGVIEKPAPGEEPSHWVSTGRYLYTPSFFDALLADLEPNTVGGEIHPMGAMLQEAQAGRLHAAVVEAPHWDTGKPEGYLRAVVDHALMDPELGPGLRDWLLQRLRSETSTR